MNAADGLLNAYAEWRRLTLVESEAIRSMQWALVERCQQAKAQMQSAIIELSESAAKEWLAAGHRMQDFEARVRTVVNELLDLERTNASDLATVRVNVEAELSATRKSNTNLRNLRRGYAPSATVGWQSYC